MTAPDDMFALGGRQDAIDERPRFSLETEVKLWAKCVLFAHLLMQIPGYDFMKSALYQRYCREPQG